MRRRHFLKTIGGAVAATTATSALPALAKVADERVPGTRTRLSLNAYSFNIPLRAGTMTVDDMIVFTADHGFDALDLTAYYIKGYPEVPPDEELYRIKHLAFVNGIEISGTGVRNDFTLDDPALRKENMDLAKNWIIAAAKMGAPMIRLFSGKALEPGADRAPVLARVIEAMKEATEFGKEHGVHIGVQNHGDFLFTADETIEVIEAVDSPWIGVTLDVGNFKTTSDPYPEIRKTTPYAISWQLKELVGTKDGPQPIDLAKIKAILDEVGYRGMLQVETLGEGDPKAKIEAYLEKVHAVFG